MTTIGTHPLIEGIHHLRQQAATGDSDALATLASIATAVADFAPAQIVETTSVTIEFPDGTVEDAEVIPDPLNHSHPDSPSTPMQDAVFFDGEQAGFDFDAPAFTEPEPQVTVSTDSVAALPETIPANVVPLPTPRRHSPFETLGPGMPLAEAKTWFFDRLDDGAQCPTCERSATVYRRRITSDMVRALLAMYRSARLNWCYLPAIEHEWNGRQEAMLAYWGLIEQATKDNRETGAPTRGWWRVTDQGRDYLRGNLSVRQTALVYNGKVRGFDGPLVTVTDAANKTFDLASLLERSRV